MSLIQRRRCWEGRRKGRSEGFPQCLSTRGTLCLCHGTRCSSRQTLSRTRPTCAARPSPPPPPAPSSRQSPPPSKALAQEIISSLVFQSRMLVHFLNLPIRKVSQIHIFSIHIGVSEVWRKCCESGIEQLVSWILRRGDEWKSGWSCTIFSCVFVSSQ